MPIKNRFAEWHAEITAWRRGFHQQPELGYDLPQTAEKVADLCRQFGCDQVVTGVGRSGVVAVIQGRGQSDRAIALRADMDALPIDEITGADHASRIPGQMHACGHDGHTAMLLGAAKYLCETRQFAGRAVLIFQPAEEGGAGALAMIQDGLIERFGISEFYGMHNMPGIAAGKFAIRPGAIMAAADFFTLTLTGRGGHAAKPQGTIDTAVVSAHVIVALQSIVSRNVDPLAACVVSICTITTDSRADNVIPQTVTLGGTVRTLDPELRDFAQTRVTEIAQGVAATFGARVDVEYHRGYPVTMNAPDPTDHAAHAARQVAGDVDMTVDPMMGAEDFSYMLERRPGAYIFMGNGDSAGLHHPAYDFNDATIPAGCSWFVQMVEDRMPL